MAEHSKRQTLKLARWVLGNHRRLKILMDLFFHDEYRVVQRASAVVRYVAAEKPEWIKPYIKQMLQYCRRPVHNAVKRNVLRILEDVDIPESLHGLAAGICFDFLNKDDEPVAIKVFSMTVLYKISLDQPGLNREIVMTLTEQLPWQTAGFRSRARKILGLLQK